MKVKEVFVLEEAEDDLEEGRDFYNTKELGVGEYFWDSVVSDIESLIIYAGIHKKKSDYIECLPNGSHMPFIIK